MEGCLHVSKASTARRDDDGTMVGADETENQRDRFNTCSVCGTLGKAPCSGPATRVAPAHAPAAHDQGKPTRRCPRLNQSEVLQKLSRQKKPRVGTGLRGIM